LPMSATTFHAPSGSFRKTVTDLPRSFILLPAGSTRVTRDRYQVRRS
jgi:hypothetical protein